MNPPHHPASPALREALHALSEDERAELEAVWNVVHHIDPPVILSPERVQNIRDHLERQVQKDRPAVRLWRMPRVPRWGVAAMALVGFVAAAVLWFLSSTAITVPPGETCLVVLPDGTRLELNSDARVAYSFLFDRAHRRITLDGEAFFQVTPGAKSFVVETFNAEVMALGTQFNVHVQGRDSLPRTDVFLAEGRVRLTATTGKQSVVLESGQASSVIGKENRPSSPRDVSSMPVLAWRPKTLVFRDLSLAEIFAEIERRYAVEIATEAHPVLESKLTYIAPRPVGVEALLSDLCQMAGLRYRRTARGYEILHSSPANR